MSKSAQSLVLLSAIAFSIGAAGAKPEAHLLPAGDFGTDDGRDLPVDSFKLNADIAAKVIARMAARKNDTLIDYEHQSLFAQINGQKVIAAGWFHEMEYRDDGLWALNVGWTEDANTHIKKKEYRYISAVFSYDSKTGEVLDIISVALTNTPALDGLQSLQALSKKFNQEHQTDNPTGDSSMDLATLTAEKNTAVAALNEANSKVTALTADLATANAKLQAVEDEKKAAALVAEKTQHETLLKAALTDGRLAPAQKPWAEKQSLAALTEYLDATSPLIDGKKQSDSNRKTDANGLTEIELAMCTNMQISPEDFLATKNKQPITKT